MRIDSQLSEREGEIYSEICLFFKHCAQTRNALVCVRVCVCVCLCAQITLQIAKESFVVVLVLSNCD